MSIINPVTLVRPETFLKPINDKNINVENTMDSFEKVLGNMLSDVSELQSQSEEMTAKMVDGSLDYLHQATAISEKATMALKLTIQVRNKIVDAYQEIMRTQF